MDIEAAVKRAVIEAVNEVLAPHLARLADPVPLVYSVADAAKVLRTSTNTVRRLVREHHLPVVPHMGERVLIPRQAVEELVSQNPRH